jgi:DNA-binding beta-propeller fold protein YncE
MSGPIELVRQPIEFVRKIDTSAQQIKNPVSLAVDGEGNVYITDSSDIPRVLKYNNQGEFVLEWGSRGNGEGQFEFLPPTPDAGPGSGFVAVDGEGNVYVSDGYNFRVQKFNSEGQFLMQFGSKGSGEGQFDEPCAGPIFVDSQSNIYVSTFPRVQKFDAEGQFLVAYGTAGDGDGQFNGAAMGTIDSAGNLYIADLLSARVQKLDPDGKFLLKWGSSGTDAGQFNLPVAIVLDSMGKLYVADNTNRIQIFDNEGTFLGLWSDAGDANPSLGGEISGIAIDGQDNIYVADGASPSIYVFHSR